MRNVQELEDLVGNRVRLTRDDGKRYVGRLKSVARQSATLFGFQEGFEGAGQKLYRFPLERISGVEDRETRGLKANGLEVSASGEQPRAVPRGDGLITQSARGDAGRQASVVGGVSGCAPPPAADGLRPMSEAPRDGSSIIVKKVGGGLDIVSWREYHTRSETRKCWIGTVTAYVSGESRFVGWCALPEAVHG